MLIESQVRFKCQGHLTDNLDRSALLFSVGLLTPPVSGPKVLGPGEHAPGDHSVRWSGGVEVRHRTDLAPGARGRPYHDLNRPSL